MMACHAWMYRPVTTNESLWRNWGWMQDSAELCGQQDAPVLYVSDQPAHAVGSPESMDVGGTSEIGESVEVATTELEQPGIMEMHVSFKQGKIEPYISPALVSRFRKEDTEKLMKLLKDVACRSIQDEAIEMVDLESLVQEDLNRMPVRKLRTLIPKLLIACYFSPEEISGKRKMKHVWERRPKDWPQEVPFKDPNNGGSDKQKPGKPQLLKMAAFLKDKYMKDIKKCVTQPVQDDSKPTMESALSAPTMPSMISSDIMERPPTETLQNRLREKMKKIAVVIYRDNPQQMNNITVAYEVVYDQFLSMQRDPREQYKYLQYGHTFENIIDQLIMGRQFSDQELQDQLMALYGYKDEEEMDNMTCHSQQQVQTYWNTNSFKYPFMSNGYPLKCKDEPLSPKSLYGSTKELSNCVTQLNPIQLNINMRDGCHMDQLGNLERREAPPPELTYKTDKILKYENGHAQLELADHDDHLGSNASWYNMEKQMDPLSHSPQHQQASVIMPTSSAQDCAMTPTNQMVTQNSGNMELANEHTQYTYMQSSPNREPPSYSATMAAQTVCSSPHQLAVSGQGLSTPYLPSSMVATTVSPLAQTALGQMSSITQMSQSVVSQMGQTPTVNLPGLASTTPSVPLPPITTVTAVSHSPNNQLPSSMTTCPSTNTRQEKMTIDCQMDPKNSPPAQQYMQGETNINGLNSDPTELEMVMSVIEMDMHKNGATSQENAVVVPNGSHVALSDTVSAAFNTLDSQASVAPGDPIQASVPPFQDAEGSMVPGQLENRKIGKRFKGNGEMPSPKKMRH